MEIQAAAAGGAGLIDMVNNWDLPKALYGFIARLSDIFWLTWGMSALATLLLATWFITSSDSGTLVIPTMHSMGEGFVAAVLLLAGGLKALQTASIPAALPVSVIMLLMTYELCKSLKEGSSAAPEPDTDRAPDASRLRVADSR